MGERAGVVVSTSSLSRTSASGVVGSTGSPRLSLISAA